VSVRRYRIHKDAVRSEQIADDSVTATEIAAGAVGTAEVVDGAVTWAKLASTSIQRGSTTVSFPFAVTGIETVSATITFPTPFPAAPTVIIVNARTAELNVCAGTRTSLSFAVLARDSEGVDFTTAQSVVIDWIAIA